jgi:hypothetical protein
METCGCSVGGANAGGACEGDAQNDESGHGMRQREPDLTVAVAAVAAAEDDDENDDDSDDDEDDDEDDDDEDDDDESRELHTCAEKPDGWSCKMVRCTTRTDSSGGVASLVPIMCPTAR